VSSSISTTIDDQLRFLEVIARHLGPNGRFVFDVFNPYFAKLVEADGIERDDTRSSGSPTGARSGVRGASRAYGGSIR